MTSNTPMFEPGAVPQTLSQDQVAFYKDEGYLILRSVFSLHEIAALGADADRVCRERTDLIDANNMRVRFKQHHQSNETIFEVFDPIADLSPVARAVTRDRRILDALHDLYGEPAELFKDKLIYKPAGATGATLHQDWIAWPDFPESFLTVLVAIDPFTADSGATEVFPRCHLQGYMSPKDGQHHYVELGELPTQPVPLLLEPGDMAIFTCFTPHRSAANTSSIARRGYFISYNARSDGGDQYDKHYREFHDWLRDKYQADKRPYLFFK
ncbi:MAG TPA: phytanoyl-CoA dioxygenase family protein [Gemmataceae bacterium]|nr:phytanoyl-CoA dioxygenase family protein [Gemmataceae bacterium]